LVIPCQYSLLIRLYRIDCNITSYILRLVSIMPAIQDAMAAEGMAMGASFPSEISQGHYLVKVVRLGPVRT
jgi:hypothetical protein